MVLWLIYSPEAEPKSSMQLEHAVAWNNPIYCMREMQVKHAARRIFQLEHVQE